MHRVHIGDNLIRVEFFDTLRARNFLGKERGFEIVGIIRIFDHSTDQVKFTRQLTNNGISATFSCDPRILTNVANSRFQGVLYFKHDNDDGVLERTKKDQYAHWYKWLVMGDELPDFFHTIRNDVDMAYINTTQTDVNKSKDDIYIEDVYVHPSEGASIHPWAHWTKATGLTVTHENDRKKRRLDFKQYPLKVVVPVGHYYESSYNGSFTEYLLEDVDPQRDSAIRCTYIVVSSIFEMINASKVVLESHYWSSFSRNDSMVRMVQYGVADISGSALRMLSNRVEYIDYIVPIWPFSTGFTYLAERESSSNMYIEPFSAGVWWSCLAIGVILAIAQRITARRPEEKEGAYIGVLASWLQQDASAVPEGASGRWSFMVVSIASMLVHAYYTSAIVSSLMSTGRGGPNSLRALGDSKYAIASEDYDYMRYLFWDVDTKRNDLEYLKKKKMTSKLYVDVKKGIELIRGGSTAYHTEYNQIYPHFNTFSDDQLCKLSYLETIPEIPTWATAARRSQFTDVFRSRGIWIHEIGIEYRQVSRLRMRPPPCRASLLAERVKFGDVAPLLGLTILGAVLSVIVLGVEIAYDKLKRQEKDKRNVGDEASVATEVEYDYVD